MSIHNLPPSADLRHALILTAMRSDGANGYSSGDAVAEFATDLALGVERRLAEADAKSPPKPEGDELLRIRAKVEVLGDLDEAEHWIGFSARNESGENVTVCLGASSDEAAVQRLRRVGAHMLRPVEIIVREVPE